MKKKSLFLLSQDSEEITQCWGFVRWLIRSWTEKYLSSRDRRMTRSWRERWNRLTRVKGSYWWRIKESHVWLCIIWTRCWLPKLSLRSTLTDCPYLTLRSSLGFFRLCTGVKGTWLSSTTKITSNILCLWLQAILKARGEERNKQRRLFVYKALVQMGRFMLRLISSIHSWIRWVALAQQNMGLMIMDISYLVLRWGRYFF